MKVTQTSTHSTDVPHSWDSDDDKPVIPKIPGQRTGLGPRPAPPVQRLTADMHPLLREIDWNGHVPTAPRGPVSMTRAQVTAELAAVEADGPHERVYDRIVLGYGIPAWQTAFGSAS